MTDNLVKRCLLILVLSVIVAGAQNASLTIPLNKTLTLWDRQLYGDYVTLDGSSTIQVTFSSVAKNISFIIFQVHSHLSNVTLYNNTNVRGSAVYGTNLGLYSPATKLDTFFVFNGNNETLKLYVSVHGYFKDDPIPGGCNMELPVPISPFLRTTYNKNYILVDGASAQLSDDPNCVNMKNMTVYFYRLYLPERNFSAESYFRGLTSMMTLGSIRDIGEVIPETGVMWSMRRMLSAYPGTGAIYVAVAYSASGYSVYVPSYTYACQPLDENDGCVLLDDVLSQTICAALLFVGMFVCYFGHRFFKTEMFLIGLTSGGLITYILIAIIADLDRSALVGASFLSGIFFGCIWLVFWYFYGIPFLAVMLSTLNVGFLVAAIVYYALPGGVVILEEDFNFWTIFIFIMLLTCVTLVSLTFLSNILCCCVLGAYAIIYPIDYYIGSNLKYIVINTIRRATVANFNFAVLTPPFEFNDLLLVLLWVGLALTGFLYQHYSSRGRPPFPPPPRSVSPWMPNLPRQSQHYGVAAVIVRPNHEAYPSSRMAVQASERTPLLA